VSNPDDPFATFRRAAAPGGTAGDSWAAAADTDDDGPVATTPEVGPPMQWLYAAGASVVVALVALVVGGTALHLVGYIAATFVCMLLVCIYRVQDTNRRVNFIEYVARPEARWIASSVLAIGMLVALPLVWSLAEELR
jgi:hypothetical protein